ncbi:MAG: ribokinase, partial [Actinobacteria bacterium]|nr:ribokinase [Actinomycetota bacterium]
MLDVIAHRGADDHSASVRAAVGGTAANAAVWAARAGARTTAVGRVGDDVAGRALRAELEALGVA